MEIGEARDILINDSFKVSVGMVEDDLVRDLATARMRLILTEKLSEVKEIVFVHPRPTFFDWLLRRKKTTRKVIDVKEILDSSNENIIFYEIKD